MIWFTTVAIGLCACSVALTEEAKTMGENHDSLKGSAPINELDMHLRFLLLPFGDEPSRRQSEQSLQYLLAHADQAHPQLLRALQGNPTALDAPAIIEVLPLFGQPESVPLLEQIMLLGDEFVSRTAGVALGRHPDASAREALLRGLQSSLCETVISAADGLLARGDNSVCPLLKQVAGHDNLIVRYHVIQAAAKLHCFKKLELISIEANEMDDDIRTLIKQIISTMEE